MTDAKLQSVLHDLRRRVRRIEVAAGLGWGSLVGLGLLLLVMWSDLVIELPPAVRLGGVLAPLVVAVFLIGRAATVARRKSSAHAVARRIDQAAGVRGEVLSGTDLWLNMGRLAGAGSPAISVGMAQMAVERAAKIASGVTPTSAVPASEMLRRPLVGFGTLFSAALIVGLIAPRMAATQLARFFDPFGDHPPYSRISFDVAPGDTHALYGGNVDISVVPVGAAVDRVDLVLRISDQVEEVLPMFPESGNKWRASVTNITAAGEYLVRSHGARSPRFRIDVITVPKLQDVRFRITPPAYTNRPPYEGPLPNEGLRGLVGTKVELWARSNRPLSKGTLTLKPMAGGAAPATQPGLPQTLTPTSDGAAEVSGSFVIERPAALELSVTDVAGQESTEQFAASVAVLHDERPFVRMVEPKANSFATPETTLDVSILAEDDYGVSRLQLFRALNNSRTRATDLPVASPPPAYFPATTPIKLSDYGLKPGDVIKLFARVEDNDPAGTKGSESSVVTVQIISQEQLESMLLAREGMEVLQAKYEQARRRMEGTDAEIAKLQEMLKKLSPDDPLTDSARKKIAELADKMQRDAEEIAKAAAHDLPYDVDRAMKRHLEKVAKQLQESAAQMRELAAREGLSAAGASDELQKAREKLGAQKQEFEQQSTEPLEHLAKIFPLKEDEMRFIELYERQRDLAQRMNAVRGIEGGDDPKAKVRMRDLEDEQRQVRADLGDLLTDIEEHAAQLPQDPQLEGLRQMAQRFAQDVRRSTAIEEMANAEGSLAEFAGSPAAQQSNDAADILEQFIKKCNGIGEEAGTCLNFQPMLAGALGNSVEQLLNSAGLGSGAMGSGMGGYSARQNSLANVGLYGSLPTMRKPSTGAGGESGVGASADGRGPGSDPQDPTSIESSSRLKASGESDAAVPAQYKRRVSDYFRRVADELGEE